MFTVGSVGRRYRSALGRHYRSTLGRYVGRVAVDTRSTYRPSVDRILAECRSSIGPVSVDMSPILDRHSIDTRSILDRHSADIFLLGFHLIKAHSIGDVSVNYRRAIGRLSVNYRRAIGRLSVSLRGRRTKGREGRS